MTRANLTKMVTTDEGEKILFTIEFCLAFLAGKIAGPNDYTGRIRSGYVWYDPTTVKRMEGKISIHQNDKIIIQSIVENRILNWKQLTDSQGKLALKFVRKYSKLLEKHGFSNLEDTIQYKAFSNTLLPSPPKITKKIICLHESEDGNSASISIGFPFDEVIKDKIKSFNSGKVLPFQIKWQPETRVWFCDFITPTLISFLMDFAANYDFNVNDDLLEVFSTYVKFTEEITVPTAIFKRNKVIIKNLTVHQKEFLIDRLAQ